MQYSEKMARSDVTIVMHWIEGCVMSSMVCLYGEPGDDQYTNARTH